MPKQPSKQVGQKTKPYHEPYMEALWETIRKIRSQILLFIIAYSILLIGIAVWGPNLVVELKTLLYILPMLGVGGYLLYEYFQILHKRPSDQKKPVFSLSVRDDGQEVPSETPTRKPNATSRQVDSSSPMTEVQQKGDSLHSIATTTLRDALDRYFDLEEFRGLCAGLKVDFDNLRGEGKNAKARELVAFMERRGRLDELINAIRQSRPGSI